MIDTRIHKLRQRLCAAISSLGANATAKDTSESFGPIFDEYPTIARPDSTSDASHSDTSIDRRRDDNQNEESSNVTPLTLLCDKSHSAAAIYLQNQIEVALQFIRHPTHTKSSALTLKQLVNIWGHPTESSSPSEGGNSAAHHALGAGFELGIKIIESAWDCVEHDPRKLPRYHRLLSNSNVNGDTPIMFACVFGRTEMLKRVLERYLELLLGDMGYCSGETIVPPDDLLWQPLRTIFSTRNEEGCSALNLSCGHGRVDTVEFLVRPLRAQVNSNGNSLHVVISLDKNSGECETDNLGTCSSSIHSFILKPTVTFAYDDVNYCKSSIEILNSELKLIRQHNNMRKDAKISGDEFLKQRDRIIECQDVLIAELDKFAAETMAELMTGESSPSESAPSPFMSKSKKIGKKSKRIVKPLQNKRSFLGNDDGLKSLRIDDDVMAGEVEIDTPFTTLQDGRVVSKTHRCDSTLELLPPDEKLCGGEGIMDSSTLSIETLFQSHLFKQYDSTISSVENENQSFFDIEARMESLCLEPSMLLLTSHGMAMQLSPCQLDAMQAILRQQLHSTEQAQKIQGRLLSKKRNENGSTKD